MAKGQFFDDTFEKIVEMGQSTAKKSAQQVVQTFSPINIIENALGQKQDNQSFKETADKLKNKNNTPLDLNKLKEKYKDQDDIKAKNLSQKLFRFVKEGEEKAIQEERQKKMQKRQQDIFEEVTKKRQAENRQDAGTSKEIPHGKERRSIFSAKKVAKREQVEVRPASGKQ